MFDAAAQRKQVSGCTGLGFSTGKGRQYKLVRYEKTYGAFYSISDWAIATLFHMMKRDGRLGRYYLCVDPMKQDAMRFLNECKATAPHMWLVNRVDPEGRPMATIGFIQLKNIRPRRAEMHWMAFKTAGADVVRVGRDAVGALMDFYDLDVAYGFTPACFTDAIRYLELIGWEKTGKLAGGAYIANRDIAVDAILMSFSRRK